MIFMSHKDEAQLLKSFIFYYFDKKKRESNNNFNYQDDNIINCKTTHL